MVPPIISHVDDLHRCVHYRGHHLIILDIVLPENLVKSESLIRSLRIPVPSPIEHRVADRVRKNLPHIRLIQHRRLRTRRHHSSLRRTARSCRNAHNRKQTRQHYRQNHPRPEHNSQTTTSQTHASTLAATCPPPNLPLSRTQRDYRNTPRTTPRPYPPDSSLKMH
ncbi:hypothetical protein Ae505Ps2_6236 [Pseudonocardia sp. Ae505_Ps2]|nr:hypothetical protein Ae505Ps2_6236 [Pseudonocardia sp. Ae505_Ps2]